MITSFVLKDSGKIADVCTNSNGSLFAVGTVNGVVCIVSMLENQICQRYENNGSITCIRWGFDDKKLFYGTIEGKIASLALENGEYCLLDDFFETASVVSIATSRKSSICIAGLIDGRVSVFDLESNKNSVFTAHSVTVTSIEILKDNSQFITTGSDGICRIWSMTSHKCISSVLIHSSPIVFARLSHDDRFIAFLSLNGSVSVGKMNPFGFSKPIMITQIGKQKLSFDFYSVVDDQNAGKILIFPQVDGNVKIVDLETKNSKCTKLSNNSLTSIIAHPSSLIFCVCGGNEDGEIYFI